MGLVSRGKLRKGAVIVFTMTIVLLSTSLHIGCREEEPKEETMIERSEVFERLVSEVRAEKERTERSEAFRKLIEEMEAEMHKIEEEALMQEKIESNSINAVEIEEAEIMEESLEAGKKEEESAEGQKDENTETEGLEDIEESNKEDICEEEEITEFISLNGNMNMLSGLELLEGAQNDRPLAIMVQNAPGARPQSGLIHADIVFETVVEYGITRFLALFSTNEAEIVGPVRSARTYYAELARSFDPIYTFWGTHDLVYRALGDMSIDLLDAHSKLHVPYTRAGWRELSRSDTVWHTAFIDTQGIKRDGESAGYSLYGGQSAMMFKEDAPEDLRGELENITIDFSSENYKASFTYDMATNKYLRSMAGQPHIDYETGEQISINNLVVLVTDIEGPINSAGHMQIRTTGSHEQGKAYYFIDGNVISGSWARDSIYDSFQFSDQDGSPILFNRGSTWICLIQSMDRVYGVPDIQM